MAMAEKHRVAPAPALGEVRAMLHNIALADCPEELRRRLARFDTNGNGVIDADELPIADRNDTISIKAFPPAIRKSMEVFDKVSARAPTTNPAPSPHKPPG